MSVEKAMVAVARHEGLRKKWVRCYLPITVSKMGNIPSPMGIRVLYPILFPHLTLMHLKVRASTTVSVR